MKKRLLILIALMLTLTPLVTAEIILNGVNNIMYNRGDQITISGYVLRGDNADGTLDFSMACGSEKFPLTKRVVGNTKTPQDFTLPVITIPATAEGSCKIKTDMIGSGGIILESQETNTFVVTKAMEAKFQFSPTQLQLGKSLAITGDIQGAGNDKKITGVAEIYMISESGERFYAGTTSIADGKLDYTYVTSPIPAGKYTIQIKAKDMYGNEHLFENVGSFNLVNEVYIFAKPTKTEVEPNEKVKIIGEVKTVLQEAVPEASVKITMEENEYIADIKDSKFEYEMQIPATMKSGRHKLKFFVEDNYGNTGTTDANIYVKPVQTTLKLQTNRNTFLPGDTVEISSTVYDQAGDVMTKMINVDMTAPNGDIAPLESIGSGQKVSFKILQFATPGTWKVGAKTEVLDATQEIDISEVRSIDVSLDNQTIVIWNNGNVEYSDPVVIDLNNGEYKITKKAVIKPDEKILIDLTKEAPTGQYDISITGGAIATPKKFQDVIILGKKTKSANTIYYFLIAVMVGALAYLLLFKKRDIVKKQIREDREKVRAQKTLERIKEMKSKEKPKFYPNREANIQDYRQQVLKEIKETEKKDQDRKRFSYRDNGMGESNQPPKKGGLFNMFE
ncbi:MAG: hypothetical protein V1645_02620 [archaeon]